MYSPNEGKYIPNPLILTLLHRLFQIYLACGDEEIVAGEEENQDDDLGIQEFNIP